MAVNSLFAKITLLKKPANWTHLRGWGKGGGVRAGDQGLGFVEKEDASTSRRRKEERERERDRERERERVIGESLKGE